LSKDIASSFRWVIGHRNRAGGRLFRGIGVAAERLRKGRRKVDSRLVAIGRKTQQIRQATDAAFGLDCDHGFMDEAPLVDLAERQSV
jgi:hypothetical protein